jgi:hypothetical protein
MNPEQFDQYDPLEARLHAMRPTDLPPELKTSLTRAEPRHIHWLAFAAPLAAAAVLLLAFFAWPRSDSDKPALSANHEARQASDLRVFVPIEERSTLVDVQDLGLLETIPTRPVRVMRYTWIDDTTFRGDDGRSTLRRTQPREQIIPVVLQAY